MQCGHKWMAALLITAALTLPAVAVNTPRCTHRELPKYPALLRTLKIGGHVKLRLTLSADGRVTSATVQGGNPILAELSSTAAKKWTYAADHSASSVAVELVFDPAAAEPKVVE